MPDYIDLCMQTWSFDYILLNKDNLSNYTDIDLSKFSQYTLPQLADVVRVHVLRDNGGYWLDTDTIMLSDKLPEEMILGNNENRTNTIGYLYAEREQLHMFREWALHQELKAEFNPDDKDWDVMGNRFTDKYLSDNRDIIIGDISNHWAETYMVSEFQSRYDKYRHFYFNTNHNLNDLKPTNMLMLHNSWTPKWYKQYNALEVLSYDCTLSNILKEALA